MRARTIFLLTVALLAPPVATPASAAVAQDIPITDSTMPAMLRLAVAHSRAAEVGPSYQVDRDGRGTNPRHGLELAFTPEGVRIEGDEAGFALRLERFGRCAGRRLTSTAPGSSTNAAEA